MYKMIKKKDLFGFINDLGKIINGIGNKLILKENKKDRALPTKLLPGPLQ